MSKRRGPRTTDKRPRPYKLVSRRAKQSREEWLKKLSKTLEHDRNLEVAIDRIRKLSRRQLIAHQTKYLVEIVKMGRSQQALLDVSRMNPEEFREFIIGKLMHNHT